MQKRHMGTVSSACSLACTKCFHGKFPPGGVRGGEGVTTLGQMRVKFIRLNVAVLIQVLVLNVGTNTQYKHSTHAPMAALSVFPLKALKES